MMAHRRRRPRLPERTRRVLTEEAERIEAAVVALDALSGYMAEQAPVTFPATPDMFALVIRDAARITRMSIKHGEVAEAPGLGTLALVEATRQALLSRKGRILDLMQPRANV